MISRITLLIALLLTIVPAEASLPYIMSDFELAQKQVIVVARWNHARLKRFKNPDGLFDHELSSWPCVQTDLVVERVIKGSIKPGIHPIVWGRYIGWDQDGTNVTDNSTSDNPFRYLIPIDRPAVWCLSYCAPPDGKSGGLILCIQALSAIQPAALAPYFAGIAGADRESAVARLLHHRDPEVVTRALTFICNALYPYYGGPFDQWKEMSQQSRFSHGNYKSRVLYEDTAGVRELLSRSDARIRVAAMAPYALLAGKSAYPVIRRMLSDVDPEVRVLAAEIYVSFKPIDLAPIRKLLDDPTPRVRIAAIEIVTSMRVDASLLEISRTTLWLRNQEEYPLNPLIDKLAEWKDPGVAPALINFLESDIGLDDGWRGKAPFRWKPGLRDIDDVPAMRARKALGAITGIDLPLNIAEARVLWERRLNQTDVVDSNTKAPECPLTAEVMNSDGPAKVRVTNRSTSDIAITRLPRTITYHYDDTPNAQQNLPPRGSADFVRLHPGESIEIPFKPAEPFESARFETRKVTLHYLNNGHQFGLAAWIGTVQAVVSDKWRNGPRTIAEVIDKWPNGRTKATGRTFNGKRHGMWILYDETGRRLAEDSYYLGVRHYRINWPRRPDWDEPE